MLLWRMEKPFHLVQILGGEKLWEECRREKLKRRERGFNVFQTRFRSFFGSFWERFSNHFPYRSFFLGGGAVSFCSWVHQNRASPFASDFYRRRGCRREFRSEEHFYPFSSQKKFRFASDFLRGGSRTSWGLEKSRDFSGSGKSGKSTWGLSKWGLKVLVHNCPRLPSIVVILWRKFLLERGLKNPEGLRHTN